MHKILVSIDGRLARINGDIFYTVISYIVCAFQAQKAYQAEQVEVVSNEEMDMIYEVLGV